MAHSDLGGIKNERFWESSGVNFGIHVQLGLCYVFSLRELEKECFTKISEFIVQKLRVK